MLELDAASHRSVEIEHINATEGAAKAGFVVRPYPLRILY